MKPKLLIILGPTASGKTALSIKAALEFGGEIVSCDSMQIYKDMNIGTATPTKEEMCGIPHHLMSFVAPNDDYSVAAYQADAKKVIADITGRGKLPILTGGTGLYINSLTYKLDFTQQEADSELRNNLNAMYESEGAEFMHSKLRELDPEAAERIHKNDKVRVVRRLEILYNKANEDYNFRVEADDYDFLIIGITKPREQLYADIDRRVDIMIEEGLIAETKNVIEKYGNNAPALRAIGYKELVSAFKNEITIDEAIELIKRSSRRYAKRQLTWFRRDDRITWFDLGSFKNTDDMHSAIIQKIRAWIN